LKFEVAIHHAGGFIFILFWRSLLVTRTKPEKSPPPGTMGEVEWKRIEPLAGDLCWGWLASSPVCLPAPGGPRSWEKISSKKNISARFYSKNVSLLKGAVLLLLHSNKELNRQAAHC